VAGRRDALDAALSLEVAPGHYAEDLSVRLALEAAGDEEVARSAHWLARGLLAFLRERKPDVDPQAGIGAAPAEGNLERLLGSH
jgi:hypothetical protein